ncbi:class I SAM-dependent methyltransferase [Streptomyces sp. NP160]|uniref:class I SAM-dependent methyltransferase n=1 Tax=Streptomyces sp. NP160 TaxID=2586637 RepID=UPI00111B0342|nr:class I SAM-dependent methyltransferase [Streptomyces sp. NP160]TNM67747.1 class I SAM-dependent methyltransferase [Streptomyces sp. NP160]
MTAADAAALWRRVATAQHGPGYADAYAERFRALAADGQDVDGEARCVQRLLLPPARVLDAGCGTGRVAARLSEAGYDVVGCDADAAMVEVARREHPDLPWLVADLAELEPRETGGCFDAVLLAGNVVPFLAGSLASAAQRCAQLLRPGGLLVAGFGLDADHLPEGCDAVPLAVVLEVFGVAGLEPRQQWSTWGGDPLTGGDGYAVLVLRTQ